MNPLDLPKFAETSCYECVELEPWRPNMTRVNAVARAMSLLAKGRYDEAAKIARDNQGGIACPEGDLDIPRALASVLMQELQESLAIRSALRPPENSVFKREGDYWTIIYHGQTARLKATRGMHCLDCLLRHPGREFHVSELITDLLEVRVAAEVAGTGRQEFGLKATVSPMWNSDAILDAQAKAQCKRRMQELRADLDEAERFNDSDRAVRARDEMRSIADQIASAVGLGGRDRRTGTDAERARSAVTKRIKESIKKIGEVIPSLGHHLAARIKTGYFCSYLQLPDRPVAWKF